ncbi:MAG: PorT family protein [Prevotellaceae bacterium]|jgi:opacity protein-like surface antigen|nr:PorT family protein [Prevotellaceae bacterium]
MKKILILSLTLILGIGATAQVKFGVKAGLNLSSLSDVETSASGASILIEENDGMAVGFHVGGFVNFSFGQYIGLQPELLFSMQGDKQKVPSTLLPAGSNGSTDYTFDYINIPVLLDIKPFANFSILVGPQIGFNIYKSATIDGKTMSGSEMDDSFEVVLGKKPFKSFDFAVVGGLQYTFIEYLTIGARYNFGLTNAFSLSESGVDITGWKNSVIQISVGWIF